MTPQGIATIALAIGIFIVAVWQRRKHPEQFPARRTNHLTQIVIVGLGIIGLTILGINNLYGLPTAISAAYLIFIFIVPLFGGYIALRLIFAIIHRLER